MRRQSPSFRAWSHASPKCCARRIVVRLHEWRLALWGGVLMGCGLLTCSALWFRGLAGVVALLVGFGTYLFHNTLQTHATQLAPAVRRRSVAAFAFCLFGSQAAGVTASGTIIDSYGFAPLLLQAAIGLVGAVFGFARALQRRPN